MVLGVVKESPDVCVPLKSVVGGLCALLNQYDVSFYVMEPRTLLTFVWRDQQFIANKDDVRRLVARARSLKTSLTKQPHQNDIEEIERRKVLERFATSRCYFLHLSDDDSGI